MTQSTALSGISTRAMTYSGPFEHTTYFSPRTGPFPGLSGHKETTSPMFAIVYGCIVSLSFNIFLNICTSLVCCR